jgi:hypothetical protein
VDISYLEPVRELHLVIFNQPALFPEELRETSLFVAEPNAQVKWPEELVRNRIVIDVPSDARLDDSIRRNFCNTSVGVLLEVVLKKTKQAVQESLQGNRFRVIMPLVAPVVPLANSATARFQNNNNNNNNVLAPQAALQDVADDAGEQPAGRGLAPAQLNPQATAVTPAKKYTPRKRAGAS